MMSEQGPPLRPPPPPPKARPTVLSKPRELNANQLDELANLTMVLREEQVRARIVHYKAELETSPELDAITAQVVEQLKQLQATAPYERAPTSQRDIALQQSQQLQKLLGRIFRSEAPSVLVEHNLKQVARRITRLFFESESADRRVEGSTQLKTIHHAEQALFYVLRRYENRMQAELEGFAYAEKETRERTFDLLHQTTNDLRVSFLSRRSPELKRLLAIFNEVVLEFVQHDLPASLPELSTEVIENCGAARAANAVGYKIPHTSFPPFRVAFEQRFVTRLINYVQERVVRRLAEETGGENSFREETIAFVQAPKIYSDICSLFCDAIYDFLCIEGFLDLPADWRAKGGSTKGGSLRP